MKTNRQWLVEMSDQKLAEFLTIGTMVRGVNYRTYAFVLSIHDIARRYTSSAVGIEQWFSAMQEYELDKGGEEK
jgi:hypothetical protein